MPLSTFQSQSRWPDSDPLAPSVDRLARVLDADSRDQGRSWAEAVGNALSRLQLGLRRHMASAQNPDGLFAALDGSRASLVRRADELCRDHTHLLEHAGSLTEEFRLFRGKVRTSGFLRLSRSAPAG